ncbi:aspartic peptidase domain-containing protein [Abortiporus biennis]|nr:aspartic peptidase domain-containing protein [Abortiporus biennis]
MRMFVPCLYLLVFYFPSVISALGVPSVDEQNQQTQGIHLPLVRKSKSVVKRAGGSAEVGLGDAEDVTYNVIVQVGDTLTSLLLDSGSADLWVISDGCTNCGDIGIPFYPHTTFNASGLEAQLRYGDSHTGTHAFGPIGKDKVGFAGLSLKDQYFAAIVDTNTTVLETGSAGIMGIGFPAISVLWRQLLQAQLNNTASSLGELTKRAALSPVDFGRPAFPSFDFLISKNHFPSPTHTKRQTAPLLSSHEVIQSFGVYGSLPSRLVNEHILHSPLVAITLQRDTIDVGGNVGLFSIGELPFGLTSDSLTWVPIRAYSVAEGGLPPAPEASNEVYPLVWEIPIDDVYFDGTKLPRSSLSDPSISLSSLVDTGNSLIRGPQDVIQHIHTMLGGTEFDCSLPHSLTFQIGGKAFSVDPRDFMHPTFTDSADLCSTNLAVTDPPGDGFLYSWSLGDPFLKSVLTAFYYGNITNPSQDPPRVGLLSTIPPNAGERLKKVVEEARKGDGTFPSKFYGVLLRNGFHYYNL